MREKLFEREEVIRSSFLASRHHCCGTEQLDQEEKEEAEGDERDQSQVVVSLITAGIVAVAVASTVAVASSIALLFRKSAGR